MPRLRTFALVGGGLALAVVAASQLLLPLRFLPQPTGPFRVGTTVFDVVDEGREDIFAPGHPRTLPTQVWYPIDAGASGPAEPYVRDGGPFRRLLREVGAPDFLMSHLTWSPTHAIADAQPAAGRFPVLVVVTGNLGYRQSQTVQVEELVSHGFVVVGLDQPGTVSSTLLGDGRRIDYAGAGIVRPLVHQSVEDEAVVPELNGTPYPQGIVPWLAEDITAVLARLDSGTLPHGLADHLDMERVGVFGMSLGGLVTAQYCATSDRPGACLIMDAPMPRDAMSKGLEVPTMWLTRPREDMVAEGWEESVIESYDGRQRKLFEQTRAPAWYATFSDRLHNDFTDGPYGSPLLEWVGLNSSHGAETHEAMRSLTVQFFGHVLRGDPEPPTSRWPSITIRHHP